MALTFLEAQAAYREDRISELSLDPDGMRFLLLRSLSRVEHTDTLARDVGQNLEAVPRRQHLRQLFESGVTAQQMQQTIEKIHAAERLVRAEHEGTLITELYKMQSFDWGGLYQNSLEKTIVDNYVKKIVSFDKLNDRIDNELLSSMRGYVQCSWYNHWTSIIIEDIFKNHTRVLPAVGLIKKVDFFIDMVPFDLKVTYLPEGYIKDRRSATGLRPELTLLKKEARSLGVQFDRTLSAGRLLELLWSRLADHPSAGAQELVCKLSEQRDEALAECVNDPDTLIRWLYENQGVRRFDASNRLFLILVNTHNYFASWKLKRAKDLLERDIGRYLNALKKGHVGRKVSFTWEGQQHSAVSDVVIVQHSA